MPKFYVNMVNTVSCQVPVEADSWEQAIDLAYDAPGMPGGITVGAFGGNSVDDGDWSADSVSDENYKTVWQQSTEGRA